jgi:hypothetical protein
MTLCQLFLQSEAAYACVSELGELGLLQFRDVSNYIKVKKKKIVFCHPWGIIIILIVSTTFCTQCFAWCYYYFDRFNYLSSTLYERWLERSNS